jgi:hypothetical protein
VTLPGLILALLELAGGHGSGAKIDDVQRLAPVLLREAERASPAFDPVLLGAIAWNESSFRNSAHGARGEIGAMQILPTGMAVLVCRGLVVSRLEDNVRCAVRILDRVRKVCGGSPSRWLSAYSGRRCGGSSYSDRVLAIRRRVR